jgi:hypothetical protein
MELGKGIAELVSNRTTFEIKMMRLYKKSPKMQFPLQHILKKF